MHPRWPRVWASDRADVLYSDVHAVASKTGEVFFCVFAKVGDGGRVYGGYRSRYEHSYSVLERLKPSIRTVLIKAILGE